MKSPLLSIATWFACFVFATAGVTIDSETFGKALGGWNKRSNKAAEYDLSGATYRTYKPEVSPTPDGGIFVSVRIDHVRGWLSSDDHAILELTISDKGVIVSAQSNIAIQGRSITSDVILGTNDAAHQAVGMDRAVQIGTDLVANLSAKLLREKIVEAGRVSFPSAVRHNYNRLFQAIRVEEPPVATVVPTTPAADISMPEETPEKPEPSAEKPEDAVKPADTGEVPPSKEAANSLLEIKPYGAPGPGPAHPKK